MTSSIHEQLEQLDQASNIAEKPSEHQDESRFATGPRLLAIIVAILLAMFLVALV